MAGRMFSSTTEMRTALADNEQQITDMEDRYAANLDDIGAVVSSALICKGVLANVAHRAGTDAHRQMEALVSALHKAAYCAALLYDVMMEVERATASAEQSVMEVN